MMLMESFHAHKGELLLLMLLSTGKSWKSHVSTAGDAWTGWRLSLWTKTRLQLFLFSVLIKQGCVVHSSRKTVVLNSFCSSGHKVCVCVSVCPLASFTEQTLQFEAVSLPDASPTSWC